MSKGTLGSFDGVVTPGVNMVEVFRQNEMFFNEHTTLRFSKMAIQKIGINTDPDTVVYINGAKILIVSGTFELAYGMIEITSLVFENAVNTQITYVY